MSFALCTLRQFAALVAAALALTLSACGGGSPSGDALPAQAAAVSHRAGLTGIVSERVDLKCVIFGVCPPPTVTGVLDDAPTQGVTFACQPSGMAGVTNANGQFTCAANDATVSFSLPMANGTINLGSSPVPPYTGVLVPVTQLENGGLNVGLKAAEILHALNHGNDALMDVGGASLPAALITQINLYIVGAGVLPAGVQSDDQFLASIQAQAGPLAFTNPVTGNSNTFLYDTVLPHLNDTIVAISQTNPIPRLNAQGQTKLSGTMLVSGGGTLNVAGCNPIPWSAGGGGVINAVVAGDISKPGQYGIVITAPGFSETVNMGAVVCPPADPFGAQSQVVAVPPFAQNDTIAVTSSFGGNALALSTPAAVPFGCTGGTISGTDIGAVNPLITMNLAVHCDFGFGPMNFTMVAKMVGASW